MGAALVLNLQAQPVEEQEEEEEERNIQPLVHFLRLKMEVDGQSRRWTSFKERLGCCGAAWGLTGRAISVQHDEEDDGIIQEPNVTPLQSSHQNNYSLGCVNLATALAAERQLRAIQAAAAASPSRVSLLRLLEEAEGGGKAVNIVVAENERKEEEGSAGGSCCVCMVRNKGAAFIPCGHTFCRVCSREVWLNRGSCPLCNRKILEILDIF